MKNLKGTFVLLDDMWIGDHATDAKADAKLLGRIGLCFLHFIKMIVITQAKVCGGLYE